MWKDFFYFSKSQRIAIVILLVIIVLVLIANYTLPIFFPTKTKVDTAFLKEAEAFRKSLVNGDSLKQMEWQEHYNGKFQAFQPYNQTKKENQYTLFPFDPNNADSSSFVRLGLKPYVASNILKYRKRGGIFKSKEDVGKVYGITPEKFKELERYITIAEIKQPKTDSTKTTTKIIKEDIIVDLNSADTTQLMKIEGIGRGYAKGIIRFRQETGGFISLDQLNEVFGMRPENFKRISPHCTVNLNLVKKIKVNTASVEILKRHPYINFYQAKAIYELRRKRGKLKNINELKELSELSNESLLKIEPYLSFE